MRPSRVALFALLGFVAVLTLAVIIVLSIDLGRYKSFAEEAVSEALGREFRIDGTFKPSIGRSISLVAEDLHLAGTDWSESHVLVFVERIEASVNTWSLIRGPIVVESLSIAGTRINLEKTEDGRNNWTLFAQDDSEDDSAGEKPSERMDELPVLPNELRIDNFALTYLSPTLRKPLHVSLEKVRETILDSGDLQLEVSGQVNDKPISIAAVAGKVEDLVALRDVTLKLDGELGEISFQGSAAIDDLLSPRRPTGRLLLQGPNAEYLTEILGLEPITSGPLSLDMSIAAAEERLNIEVRGVFGEFTLDVSGSLVDLDNLNDMDVKASAAGPNAAAIGRLLGNDTVPEDPFRITAVARIAGKNIQIEEANVEIGATRFDARGEFANFPSPDGAAMDLDISGPDFGRFNRLLGLPGKLTGPFRLDAKLAELPDGNASVQLNAAAEDVNFSVDGIVVDQPGFEGSTLDIAFNGPNFDVLAQAASLSTAPAVDFDARISAKKTNSGVQLSDSFARIGKDSLLVSGLIGNEPLKQDTDLTFEVSGPGLRKTLVAFGLDAGKLPPGKWSATGRVFRETDHFIVQELRATIGANREYRLSVDGRITDDPDRAGSSGKISFSGSDLGALASAVGVARMPGAPFQIAADVERVANGQRITNGRIQLGKDSVEITGLVGDPPLLQGTDIRFKLSAADLKSSLESFEFSADQVPPGRFSATGQVRYLGNDFALQNVSAALAGAELKVSGSVGALPALDGTDIDVSLAGDNLASLLPSGVVFEAKADPFSIQSKLRLADNVLSISNAEVRLGEARLTGTVSTVFEPLLSNGTFSVQASSPDFGHLVTAYAEHISDVKVPMTFRTRGDWDRNYWNFEDLLLTVAKARFSVAGTLDGPPNFEHTDLRTDLHIDNVRYLSSLAGYELPSESVTLHGHLTGTSDEMTLSDFGLMLGESDIDGTFVLRDGERSSAKIEIVSNRLDLSAYLPPLKEPAATPADEAPAAPKTKVIPDTPLPLDQLRRFDATIDVRFGELKLRQRLMTEVRLVGSLKSGELKVTDFSLTGDRGSSLSGRFRLKPDGSRADLGLDVTGSKLTLGLAAETVQELAALPQYEVDYVLQGSGATVAEIAGSFNGYMRLISGPGRIRAGAARIFTQDVVAELLNNLNPFVKTDPYTNVKCLVFLAKVTDGMVTGKPALVLQTDKLNAFANAEVDLKTEKLAVELNMVPQTGIGIGLSDLVTPYTKIGGTLARPAMVLNPEGALVEGSVVVATAGLSFLARRFKERYLSAKDACGKAIEDTEKEFEALEARYRFE